VLSVGLFFDGCFASAWQGALTKACAVGGLGLLRMRCQRVDGAPTKVCATMPRMTLVEATYELQKPLTEAQLRALGTFANTYGLRRFRINDKNHLSFEYDASRLRDTEVAHVLHQLNIPVTRKVN